MKQIAAVILRQQDKLLICQRGAGGSCAFLWEFPGGKREDSESLEECAVRECREELGVTVGRLQLYGKTVYEYPERTVSITFFLGEILDGVPARSVHSTIRWVLPSQLADYPFCPANREILVRLQAQQAESNQTRKEE